MIKNKIKIVIYILIIIILAVIIINIVKNRNDENDENAEIEEITYLNEETTLTSKYNEDTLMYEFYDEYGNLYCSVSDISTYEYLLENPDEIENYIMSVQELETVE